MTPEEIFHRMFDNDPFSRWMGMKLVEVGGGRCVLEMDVRPDMLNGFGVAHGGIAFSLADSAFAFACNSRGRHTVSVHCTVEHVAPVYSGDRLRATAEEENLGQTLSHYRVTVTREDGAPVAFFRGLAYRKQQTWQ